MISFLIKFPKKSGLFICSMCLLCSAGHANNARDGAARAFQQRMDRVQLQNNQLSTSPSTAPEFGEEAPLMPEPTPSFPPTNRSYVPGPSAHPLQKMHELNQDVGSIMVKLDRLERKINYLFQRQEELVKKKAEESIMDKPKPSSKSKKRKKS